MKREKRAEQNTTKQENITAVKKEKEKNMSKEKEKEKNMSKEEHIQPKRTASLYVKWAVRHLALIEECQTKLNNEGNNNLTDILMVMDVERQNLINFNPAYREAQEILDSIRDINFYTTE